jgi:hypothetical protein
MIEDHAPGAGGALIDGCDELSGSGHRPIMPNAACSYGGNARVVVVPVFNVPAMCAVAALAAAPIVLSAVAHAQPNPAVPVGDPRAACESFEFGGVWVDNGPPHAVCQYIVEGQFYYDNGLYTGTLVYRDGANVPTERPVIPEVLTVPGGRPPLVLIGPPL